MTDEKARQLLDEAIKTEPGLIDHDTDLEQFRMCYDWLETKKKTRKVNKTIGDSRTLVMYTRAWAFDYISHSAFIASVVAAGIPYEVSPRGIYIGIKTPNYESPTA
jgi:hypothetical protein